MAEANCATAHETATDELPSSHTRDTDSTDHPMSFVQRQVSELVQGRSDDSGPVVILPVGKAGVGKTTLINNFIGLTGANAFQAAMGASSVTTDVAHHDKKINDVNVRLINMPGLYAADVQQRVGVPRNVMAKLKAVTGKGVDVVFYCISLMNRFENIDWKIIDTLIKLFGKEIWKRVIFVFTFADIAEYQGENPLTLADGYIPKFKQYLKKKGVQQEIRLIHSTSEEADICSFNGIAGILVSKMPTSQEGWKDLLFLLVLKRCRDENIPAVLKMWSMYFNWHEAKKTLKITSKCGGAGAAIGSTVGAVVGALVGALATAAVGGVGAFATAAAGAALGGLMGTVGGFGSVAGTALGIRSTYIIATRRGIISAEKNKLEIQKMPEAESAASEKTI